MLDIKMIKTNLTPANLYISESEFNNLVSAAEQEWYVNNQQSKCKEKCVQYWINISPELVNPDYIKELKESYTNAGWDIVRVKWITDRRTTLMVFLSMSK